MERNNNKNKNIKLQIKSFLKKISLQLYFKRVNVPTVSKARWQSIILLVQHGKRLDRQKSSVSPLGLQAMFQNP